MTVDKDEIQKMMSASKIISAIISHSGPQTIPVDVFLKAGAVQEELLIDYDGEAEGGPTFTFDIRPVKGENQDEQPDSN